MNKIATLCLLVRRGEVLLAKKREGGFGAGFWNAFGGKPKAGETIEAATIREVQEEVCLEVASADLKKMGIVRFHFAGEFKWEVHVFVAEDWQGEPESTQEMENPTWYRLTHIPWGKMWASDRAWMPSVLSGEKIFWEVYYSADGETVERIISHEVDF